MNSLLGDDATLETQEAIPTTLAVNLGSATSQSLTYTEAGILTRVSLAQLSTPIGSLAANLEIQIDGLTAITYNLYTGGVRNTALLAFGGESGSYVVFGFNARYVSSVRVGVNISVAGSGTIYLGVCRNRRY